MKDLEVMQVIRTRILRRGKGTNDDPIRIITQYWDMEGTLLVEVEPLPYKAPGSGMARKEWP